MLLLGVALIGFTRLEDRAILRIPGPAANAMAAMAVPPAEEVDDGSYADEPEGVVRVSNVARLPRNRMRRALRERDMSNIATRGPVAAAVVPGVAPTGEEGNAATAAAIADAFTPTATTTPVTLASAGPGLGPVANSVFSAAVPPPATGGDTGGGGNGGNNGGNNGGTGENPVTAVPEPATWLSLMLGMFAIGGVLRRRNRAILRPLATR